LREDAGFSSGVIPTAASSGRVSSKMRPLDRAMVIMVLAFRYNILPLPFSRQRERVAPLHRERVLISVGACFNKRLLFNSANITTQLHQLALNMLIATIQMVDAVYHGFALRHQSGDNQTG